MCHIIESQRDTLCLKLLCWAMSVSRSAYYNWQTGRKNTCSDKDREAKVQLAKAFDNHKKRCGSRRLVEELADQGIQAGRYRVRRWMSELGLQAIQPCNFVPRLTDSRYTYKPSPNLLLERNIGASAINQVRGGDITYILLGAGKWLYLATML